MESFFFSLLRALLYVTSVLLICKCFLFFFTKPFSAWCLVVLVTYITSQNLPAMLGSTVDVAQPTFLARSHGSFPSPFPLMVSDFIFTFSSLSLLSLAFS
jgi:hypothetical protein